MEKKREKIRWKKIKRKKRERKWKKRKKKRVNPWVLQIFHNYSNFNDIFFLNLE